MTSTTLFPAQKRRKKFFFFFLLFLHEGRQPLHVNDSHHMHLHTKQSIMSDFEKCTYDIHSNGLAVRFIAGYVSYGSMAWLFSHLFLENILDHPTAHIIALSWVDNMTRASWAWYNASHPCEYSTFALSFHIHFLLPNLWTFSQIRELFSNYDLYLKSHEVIFSKIGHFF